MVSAKAFKVSYKKETSVKDKTIEVMFWLLRLLTLFLLVSVFISNFNPARVTPLINRNISLFTTAVSHSRLTSGFPSIGGSPFFEELGIMYIRPFTIAVLMVSAVCIIIGIVLCFFGAALSFGNSRAKSISLWIPIGGVFVILLGLGGILLAYSHILNPYVPNPEFLDYVTEQVQPHFPWGFWLFLGGAVAVFALTLILRIIYRRDKTEKKFRFSERHKLFLYALPIILLTFLFSYLPLAGWRFAFFNFDSNPYGTGPIAYGRATLEWFSFLFRNPQTRSDFFQVLRNTFVMSGLGIAVSFLPMLFAIFFSEIKSRPFGRVVQTLTTLPNFISWILIYAVALTLFSHNGLFNNIVSAIIGREYNVDHLAQTGIAPWFQMLAWGVWRGLGWSAIIYLAGIAGIDQQMYEAASIDGARRWRKIWHITIPSLMPTFSVLLLLSIAGMLSNGLEQYLVFINPATATRLRVLDLYIFQIGLDEGGTNMIPLATVLSIGRSVFSVLLLFIANWTSKFIRGESII